MTKGQAARALSRAIGELKDVDVQLQNLFTEAGLKWTDYEGPASSRLFQAICRASADQLQILVEETAKQYRGQQEELQSALSRYLSLPGTVWDGRVARDFNKSCPYPGMRSFTSPKGFYGREQLSAEIRSKSDQSPLILVTGASGSGKSSVVMAGVFPEWKTDYGEETTFQIRPEGNPFEALYISLFPVLGQARAEQFRTASRDVFTRLAKFLAEEGIGHPLFFVDPFEKVFAANSDAGEQLRDDFVASLVNFAQQDPNGARLILGMRDDFLGALSRFPELCRFTDANLVRVFPLDEDSLRQAVQQPAADHGVEAEQEIVDDIVEKVLGRSGMLPLMQDVLKSLWEKEAKGDLATSHRLTAKSYFTLGGVLGSLTKRLDSLCEEKGEETLRRIFLRTVQVASDQTTPVISRRGHQGELSESDRLILNELIEKKVLVPFDPDPGQSQGTFGLPHEAVIQNWTRLRTWITDSRHVLTLLSRLNEDVRERQRKLHEHAEQASQIDREILWRGGRLDDLSKLGENDFEQLGFTEEMKEFLDSSQKQQQAEHDREVQLAQERETAARLREADANERAESARKYAESETKLKQNAVRAARISLALMYIAALTSLGAMWFKVESDRELVEAERRLDLNNLQEASRAFDAHNLKMANGFLDRVKRQNRSTNFRGKNYPCFAWNFLKHKTTGGLFSLYGHRHQVASVAFSPDGQRIVTGSFDKTAQVWDFRTGRSLFELQGHVEKITSVAFSHNGQWIVTGSMDKTMRLWDSRTGQLVLEFQGHTGGISSVSFSPDGQRIVTGSYDKTAYVWDSRTGQTVLKLFGHIDRITSVSFSPDSQRIVTGSLDRTARVWDSETGQSVLELSGHSAGINSVSFSADGQRIITGSGDKTARVWDSRTAQSVLELQGHAGAIMSVAISPDGQRIVTGSLDRTARVWDSQTGQSVLELHGHCAGINSVSFAPDGQRIVTGSRDLTANVWDSRTSLSMLELQGHAGKVRSVSFSPEGQRLVTGSSDKTARVWDSETGRTLLELRGHSDEISSVSFSPDGQLIVTGSCDETARVWDSRKGQCLLELQGHAGEIRSVSFSPDGQRLVTGSSDKTARVWDSRTGESLLELQGHSGEITSVSFSPDGQRLVTGSSDKTARVWNSRTGQSVIVLQGHAAVRTSVIFLLKGRIEVVSEDNIPGVWNSLPGQSVAGLQGHAEEITSVAFSAGGQRVITGSLDGTALVWDSRTGQTVLELQGHAVGVTSVAFSPDNQRILTGSLDKTARVWDSRTGQSLLELQGHAAGISCVSFSPDGQRVVTGSVDKTIHVWDSRAGQSAHEWQNDSDLVVNTSFSADGQLLGTSSLDKTARVNNVFVMPLNITWTEQKWRSAITRPRPDLHQMEAKRLSELGEKFAAQIQLALEQQALGQEKVDEKKPEEAKPFFAMAKELWPKPSPLEIIAPETSASKAPEKE